MKLGCKTGLGTIALLLGFAGNIQAQTSPKVSLQVVGNLGITTQYKDLEAPFWTKDIPAATGGSITASIKPWNEMGLKGPEVFKLLSQGVFDVGTTQLGFVAGDAAINDATDLAGVSPTIQMFREVTQAFRPALERHYDQQFKVKLMGMFSFQAQVLFCRSDIKGLADLKGRKVRTSGASQADFISYFGGSGVNMAFGEVQQALQNGVIDCAITGTLGGTRRNGTTVPSTCTPCRSTGAPACQRSTTTAGESSTPTNKRRWSANTRGWRRPYSTKTCVRTTSAWPATPEAPAPKVLQLTWCWSIPLQAMPNCGVRRW